MTEGSDEGKERIEVRVKKGANERTLKMADQMGSLLNSPIFAEMVRKVVEEMCLEGRLVYDIDKDELLESEDLAKEIARRVLSEQGPSLPEVKRMDRRKRL